MFSFFLSYFAYKFLIANSVGHDQMPHSKASKLGKHTCDKFQRGIREVFLSFPGGF